MATLQIGRPDRGGQAILRVVRHADGFLFCVEGSDMAYRPEDFFLHAARRFRQPSIDRGLHVETVVERVAELGNAASRNEYRSFFACQFVIRQYFVAMLP